MTVLAVASQKGGVGKSLFTRCLAVAALSDGLRSAVIDADPQGSTAKWASRRAQPGEWSEPVGHGGLHEALTEVKKAGIIISAVPSKSPTVTKACSALWARVKANFLYL